MARLPCPVSPDIQLTSVDAAFVSFKGKNRRTLIIKRIMCQRIEPMPDKALDPVEWELVRADIAMEKARLKANGDWSKWEEFQTQTNARLAAYAAPLDWRARERFALRWDRTHEDS